ncbi:hypothetical protein HZA45_00280 [Candidatus Peregrinibacteria bacterium]|nr:hypothetical protein [Candidatus Peregrinibacteria bacterium]
MDHTQIIGHARQIAELETDIANGHLAHAYLFAGPANIGKTTVAHWFARELLLQGLSDEARGAAEAEIDRLLHPDFLVLDDLWIEEVREDWDVIARTSNIPQQHRSKAPRIMKTDVIGIDDVRVIQQRLHETGHGAVRVCLIRGAERMRDEAANAFLKILEEPPPGRVFLLTTDSISSLLPTTISRTRVLHFQPVAEPQMNPLLRDLPEEEQHFLLHLAQGAPGILKSFIDDPDRLRGERLLHSKALSFWKSTSPGERLKLLSALSKRGQEADRFLFHLALTLREHALSRASERAFSRLLQGFETNAHRGLLTEQFAMAIE